MTTLTRKQDRTYGPKEYTEGGHRYRITARVQHDDRCGNGHNTFSITGSIDVMRGGAWRDDAGGCLHAEIAQHFPELAPFIKWHLTATDGPTHYLANTLYWLGWSGWTDAKPGSPPNLQHARNCAVWPDMPESFLAPAKPAPGSDEVFTWKARRAEIERALADRLPALMVEFRSAVESLGFTY